MVVGAWNLDKRKLSRDDWELTGRELDVELVVCRKEQWGKLSFQGRAIAVLYIHSFAKLRI